MAGKSCAKGRMTGFGDAENRVLSPKEGLSRRWNGLELQTKAGRDRWNGLEVWKEAVAGRWNGLEVWKEALPGRWNSPKQRPLQALSRHCSPRQQGAGEWRAVILPSRRDFRHLDREKRRRLLLLLSMRTAARKMLIGGDAISRGTCAPLREGQQQEQDLTLA